MSLWWGAVFERGYGGWVFAGRLVLHTDLDARDLHYDNIEMPPLNLCKSCPMRPVVFRWIAMAALLVAACSAGCRRKETPTAVVSPARKVSMLPPTQGYVHDAACGTCHADLVASYQSMGMSQSFSVPAKAPVIEDFEQNHFYHAASDQHFEMERRGQEIFQRRYQLDANAQRINELEVRVDAILGSGNHIRAYLYRTPAGELFQLPLAWYTQANSWGMNPGYDRPNHWGFHRKITRECMFCHNAYPLDLEPGSDAFWQPHQFPEALPHGIGCQRCHGPGQKHVILAADPVASIEDIRSAVVNPAKLSPALREDVCYQCHLQPSSQILSEMVRVGRNDYSYRPGEPLNDYRVFLDYAESSSSAQHEEERFEINHHPYRLRQSRCYLESEEGISCLSCHDPHRKPAPAERIQRVRDVCLSCHKLAECPAPEADYAPAAQPPSSAKPSGPSAESRAAEHPTELRPDSQHDSSASVTPGDCAACHMPQRRTHDAIHALMTDHKITARPEPASVRTAPRSEPPPAQSIEAFAYWDNDNQRTGEQAIDLYVAIASSLTGNDQQLQRLFQMLSGGRATAIQPLAELANALRERGDLENELAVLLQIVNLHPQHPQANLEVAMALAAAGRHEEALIHYRRGLEFGPPQPEAHLGIGMAMLAREQPHEALKYFREAVRLRPLYPEGLLNLGIVLFSIGEFEESRDALERAMAADPSFVEAEYYLQRMPN